MRNLLLGNGINIQFGGPAYSSSYIMKRIRYQATLEEFKELFDNEITSNEIIELLKRFVVEANKVKSGEYDMYAQDNDTKEAVEDFKKRYADWSIQKPHDIMLEDWFLLVHVFFLKNSDLERMRESAVRGFEQIILNAIYNNGKIQDIYKEMSSYRKVTKWFKSYDNIFTLNYDDNIELLTGKEVYHLHGDFSVPMNCENENSVTGYMRKKENQIVGQMDRKQCFCNALLNYSGRLKKQTIDENHQLNLVGNSWVERYMSDEKFREELEEKKASNFNEYQFMMTKIEHPELYVATPYFFDLFEDVEGELDIIGMSPNNDVHIFDAILKNEKITKVNFYYKKMNEKEYVEKNYPESIFSCESVEGLWRKLGCKHVVYRYNHNLPAVQHVTDFVQAFNALSFDEISTKTVIEEIQKLSKSEMRRLCKLVKDELLRRNPNHNSLNDQEFIKENAAISYIALQEGVLPTVLYLVCCMNYKHIED